MKRIAVIGSGVYGCYIIDSLLKKEPNIDITLFEVGDEKVLTEKEIGFKTNIIKRNYAATSKGRYFGFGGSSNKWGGAILLFTKNDFKNPQGFLADIVELNEKYRDVIYSKFGFGNKFDEYIIDDNIFVKTGIWLGYFKRNLFHTFNILKRSQVNVISKARVVRINMSINNNIKSLVYKKGGKLYTESYDHYFLTAGAFESHRLLLNSGLSENGKYRFSDHLSQKVFKIKGDTVIGGIDYAFKIKGTSFITNRIVGEIDGHSFFANPIYNSEFSFFLNLKSLLFKGVYSFQLIKDIFKDSSSFIFFLWYALIKKKLFVYKNEWYIYIDIENPIGDSYIQLSSENDLKGEPALDLAFSVKEDTALIFEKAKLLIKSYLEANNVLFEECNSKIEVEKSEDTYHPFGMFYQFDSKDEYFNKYGNMLVVNTGVLPRAGGINSTAAMFPLIEEYLNYYFDYET